MRSLLVIFFLAMSSAPSAFADSTHEPQPETRHDEVSFEKQQPIAEHQVAPSNIRFHTSENVDPTKMFGINDQVTDLATQRMMEVMTKRLSSLIQMEPLPACSENKVDQKPSAGFSLQSQTFDFLFYDIASGEQRGRATTWDQKAVPYDSNASWGIGEETDPRVILARLSHITCLPTRIHFVTVDGNRALEYRMGERAWDADSTPK